jgi:hypothetical protein
MASEKAKQMKKWLSGNSSIPLTPLLSDRRSRVKPGDDGQQTSVIPQRLAQAPTSIKRMMYLWLRLSPDDSHKRRLIQGGRTASVAYFASMNLDNWWGMMMTYRRLRLSPEKSGTEEKVVSRKFRYTTRTPLLSDRRSRVKPGDDGQQTSVIPQRFVQAPTIIKGMMYLRLRLAPDGSRKHRLIQGGGRTASVVYFTSMNLDNRWGMMMTYRRLRLFLNDSCKCRPAHRGWRIAGFVNPLTWWRM